jgi:SAM-dependent methyltransferase
MSKLFLIVILAILLSNCKPVSVLERFEFEIGYYDLKANDTIWDISNANAERDLHFAKTYSNLHFYFSQTDQAERFSRLNKSNATWEKIKKDKDSVFLPSGSTNVIILYDNYHLLRNFDRTLSQFHRILRPGGKLIIVTGYDNISQKKWRSWTTVPFPSESVIEPYLVKYGFKKLKFLTYKRPQAKTETLLFQFGKA